jgi:hypothetical protein
MCLGILVLKVVIKMTDEASGRQPRLPVPHAKSVPLRITLNVHVLEQTTVAGSRAS